jgi:CO/xanthine dehydrogenase FAD-binding subunit
MSFLILMLPKFDLYSPSNLKEALSLLQEKGEGSAILAGGTDLIPRIRARELRPKYVVDISSLKELKYAKKDGDTIRVGALTTVDEIGRSRLFKNGCDIFQAVSKKFGGPHIRNMATLAGNLGTAISSSDFIPVFMALDARVKVNNGAGSSREITIEELIPSKRCVTCAPQEIMTEIYLRDMDSNEYCCFEKLGRRAIMDVAMVSSTVYLKLDKSKKKIEDIRAVFNRLKGKIPERAKKTEEHLRGKVYNEKTLEEALKILGSELNLTSDYRASREYREDMAKVLFKRAMTKCVEKIQGGASK